MSTEEIDSSSVAAEIMDSIVDDVLHVFYIEPWPRREIPPNSKIPIHVRFSPDKLSGFGKVFTNYKFYFEDEHGNEMNQVR